VKKVMAVRLAYRSAGPAGLVVAAALLVAACGSSGTGSSPGSTHPKHTTTSTTSAPLTTSSPSSSTSTTSGAGSGPMVTASLPVVVCQTTSGVSTTTTSLPASVSVSVPPSQSQQGNLAVYSDLTGRLMLVGPTVGWTCTGTFGADGSGMMAISPVGTTVPATGTTWHLPASSPTQAIVAMESGASPVQGAALACPLFSAAKAATQQNLGQGCAVTSPPQERVVRTSAVQVGFQDPAGVAGVGYPSGGLNAANGVVLYQPKTTEATAYQATCTLPAAQQDLCTAVLNQFATTFG
jgi:hypothetical protein